MGFRQQEKSNMTRKELEDAMVQLFLEKGYDDTSIRDIADKAGYSVGSFYRHWKSKQQAFLEFWDEYVAEYIRGSIENAPADASMDEMIQYLIKRSEEYGKNEITMKLFLTSDMLSAQADFQDLNSWSERFTQMLYDFIKRATSCSDERRLVSTAFVLNSILNSHAIQFTNSVPSRYKIDNDTLTSCIKAILRDLDTYGS